jgi:hypothetical protein
LIRELELSASNDGWDRIIVNSQVSSIAATSNSINSLEKRNLQLRQEKERRLKHISEVQEQIEILWTKLGVDQTYQYDFSRSKESLISVSSASRKLVDFMEGELNRLKVLKQESLQGMILDVRREIESLWSELRYGEEQKKAFLPFFNNSQFTGEFNHSIYFEIAYFSSEFQLERHEEEKEKLSSELKELQIILELVDKREDYLNAIHEVSLMSQDQSRYKSRDAFKILKREEEVRIIQSKKLPKLEQKLIAEIARWEEQRGRPLMVEGERYLDVLKAEAEKKSKETQKKEASRSTRKEKPNLSATMQSPLKKASAVAPSRTPMRDFRTPTKASAAAALTQTAKFSEKKLLASSSKSLFQGTSRSGVKAPKPAVSSTSKRQVDTPALKRTLRNNNNNQPPLSKINESEEGLPELLLKVAEAEYLGNYEEAAVILTKALKAAETPEDIRDVYSKRSTIYQKLHEYGKSLEDSEMALKIHEKCEM